MKPIKIVQIGVGHAHAPSNFNSFARQKELFDLAGYVVLPGEEARYERFASAYAGYPRLSLEEALAIPGLEAAAVEAEETILGDAALTAAKRGLHIFLDKPGAVDGESFEEFLSIMKKSGRVLTMGYMYRQNPAILRARERIASGALGTVYCVEAHMDCRNDEDTRHWLKNFPGGMLWFLGCHLVDLVLTLQGIPEEIIPLSSCTGIGGVTGMDLGMAAFRYPNGRSFIKTCASEPGGFMRRQLIICGSLGTVEIQPLEQYIPPVGDCDHVTHIRETYADDPAGWTARGEDKTLGPYNRYDGMTTDFARFVRGELDNPYTLEYEARLHRILRAACGVETDWRGEIRL